MLGELSLGLVIPGFPAFFGFHFNYETDHLSIENP